MAIPISKKVSRKFPRLTDQKGRAIVVTMYPDGTLGFRAERTQHEDFIPLDVVRVRAAMVTADEVKCPALIVRRRRR